MRRGTYSFRWAGTILLVALVSALPSQSVRAKYIKADLIDVPVDRLIRNLEVLARENPKDAGVRLNLARLHAMVYALKTDTAKVLRGRENDGAWFGHVHAHVPFEVKPSDDEDRVKAPREYLKKAIEYYKEVLRLDRGDLTAALGYAWCLEQSGDKQRAVTEYRKVIAASWRKERNMKSTTPSWSSLTAEAAGYLIPLLDPKKNRSEIALLNTRIKQMETVRRPVTPLVIPLRDGVAPIQLEDRSASVSFDADGTGLKKRWTWITKDAGWLVYDPRGTGEVTSALQMFGSVSFWLFWENGYRALAALDDDRDGILTGNELQGFAIWQDPNRNGICDWGEVRPLVNWGIVAISCHYARDDTHADLIAYSQHGVLFCDGSSRPTYDLALRPAISTVD